MRPSKTVLIGAGSASFGLGELATLIRERQLRGSTISLVDLNPKGLELIHKLAERMAGEWETGVIIESTTNRREALKSADFVAVTIETGPREGLWEQDYALTLQHGLRQPYAENGGPGGFAHTLRNIPPMMDIARDMQALCPEAWLISLTNPLPRLCRAVTRYTDVKTVGLCHQVYYGYLILALAFADELGIERPPVLPNGAAYVMADAIGWDNAYILNAQAVQKLAVRSAGLNHFIWALDIRVRETGEDLYPRLMAKLDAMPPGFEPLARDIYKAIGTMPIGGDTHISEYLPWMVNNQRKPWDRYSIPLYEWDVWAGRREAMWKRIEAMVTGTEPIAPLKNAHSEGVYEIISGIMGDKHLPMEAVNIPNRGLITNLPEETIVEVPGLIDITGVNGVAVGDLPPMVAELCRREAALVELVVQAGVEGNREAALQALLLDPHVDDIELARDVLDTYLEAFAEWLPQFHDEWHWE
jgi:alpha-galactosidase